MRRKRLNHVADTLCQMFRGWRLANSYRGLAALGTGILVIDAKEGACTFNGMTIEPLLIAGELKAWLAKDLQDNQIPVAAICAATLTVQLELTRIQGKRRATPIQHMSADGKPIRTGGFHRLKMQCESRVVTDEASYTATLSDVVEWPGNWP